MIACLRACFAFSRVSTVCSPQGISGSISSSLYTLNDSLCKWFIYWQLEQDHGRIARTSKACHAALSLPPLSASFEIDSLASFAEDRTEMPLTMISQGSITLRRLRSEGTLTEVSLLQNEVKENNLQSSSGYRAAFLGVESTV